ncbi:hypothetical protein D3C72_2189600 [compost metagenome]
MAPNTPLRVRTWRPIITFSRAVMLWNRRMFWKVREMPASTTLCGLLIRSGLPSNITRPCSARYNPVSTLNRVVLPAPLGPSRPRISPRRMLRSMPCRACRPPKNLLT